MSFSGGTYISESSKEVFLLSDALKSTHKYFISGGKYSSNPSSYLKSGYSADVENDMYEVSKSTLRNVFLESDNKEGGSIGKLVTIAIVIIAIGVTIYFNRTKISQFCKTHLS